MIWYFNSVLWPPCVQFLRSGFSTGWADHNEAAYWWRLKGDGALRTVWPSAAPAFQHQPFQMQLDNTGWCPASDWPLSRLVTKPATEEHSCALTPPRSNSISPIKGGAARGQGQLPGWPLMSHHVWTCPRTKHTPKRLIRICRDERGQEGSGLFQAVICQCVCVRVWCWHGDLVSDCRTTGPSLKPPPDVQLLSQVSLFRSWREELHQGWSHITEPACLSGWA